MKLAVHRSSLYHPEIFTINCLSFDVFGKHLAVLRSSTNDSGAGPRYLIEFWNCLHLPSVWLEQIIHRKEGIEAIEWASGRLFAATSDGCVIEYSPHSAEQTSLLQVSASPIWCIARNKKGSELAIGTDDGSIHILTVLDQGLELKRTLPAALDKRILCLCWNESENVLVGGSMDVICVWDIDSGRSKLQIDVGRSVKRVATIVWCLAVTRDFTIVSGDSRGKVNFWDGKTGTLINSHQVHQADVLALCLLKGDCNIFAAGIDPKIQEFGQSQRKNRRDKQMLQYHSTTVHSGPMTEWRPRFSRMLHSHDVRSLVMSKEWLFSAGIDTYIWLSKFKPTTYIQIPPVYSHRCKIARNARFLMLQYSTWLEVWRLADADESNVPDIDAVAMPIKKQPEKLVQLISKGSKWIVCSDISSDGQYVAYSDQTATRIYKIAIENENITIVPVKCVNESSLLPSINMQFINENSLIMSTLNGGIGIVSIDGSVSRQETFKDFTVSGCIRCICISCDGQLIVLTTSRYDVYIFDLKTQTLLHKLEKRRAVPFDIVFGPSGRLFVLYGDRMIIEYDCKTGKSINSELNLNDSFPNDSLGPTRLNVGNENLLVYSQNRLAIVQLHNTGKMIPTVDRYDHLCLASWLKDDNSLLVVSVDKKQYMGRLPPAFKVHKFGTG